VLGGFASKVLSDFAASASQLRCNVLARFAPKVLGDFAPSLFSRFAARCSEAFASMVLRDFAARCFAASLHSAFTARLVLARRLPVLGAWLYVTFEISSVGSLLTS
jgi:hypothetical protein